MRFAILLVILGLGLAGPADAQDRIAYANIELVLSLMPEMKTASGSIEAFGQDLAGKLETKRAYARQKLEEAQEAAAGGASDEELSGYRTELERLDTEIQKGAAEADASLAKRRGELMQPILEKLEATMKELAEDEGWDLILNSVDATGTSIVLWGRADRDVTKKILERLGIEVPPSSKP